MEKLSYNKLADVQEVKIKEDIRFDIPKGRFKFLSRALYDNLFIFPKANILYAALIVLAAVSDLLNSELNRFPLALCIVLVLKGTLVFLMNRQYGSFKESRIFPVVSKDGVIQVATYAENGRYIVVSKASWMDIEAIRFYNDFISVQIKDMKGIQDGGRLIYIMTDDALKYKDEIAFLWAEALKDTARLPIWTESWLGYGHTISPAEGELLTEGMPYDSVLLTYPVPVFDTMQYADLSSGKSVNFFQLHPLTPEELAYKAEQSTSALLDRIYPEDSNLMEILLGRMNSLGQR